MTPEELDRYLDQAWEPGRAVGAVSAPASVIREHAVGFVPAAWRVRPPSRLIDLGSGVGVPGIHLASFLEVTAVTLVDASKRRCEIAAAAVGALGLDDRVVIRAARAEELGADGRWRGRFDAVVARLLGPPGEVAELGLPLLSEGGRLVVSVNQAGAAWWQDAPLARVGAVFEGEWCHGSSRFVSVRAQGSCPHRYPRRAAARRRRPWPGTEPV